MLDYSAIRDIAEQHARRAKAAGRRPLSVKGFDPGDPTAFIKRIPFLGSYVPTGWVVADGIDGVLVDKTGWDHSGPALGIDGLAKWIRGFQQSGDNYGVAVVEEGEFQVYIQVFTPDPRDFTHTGAMTAGDLAKLTARRY